MKLIPTLDRLLVDGVSPGDGELWCGVVSEVGPNVTKVFKGNTVHFDKAPARLVRDKLFLIQEDDVLLVEEKTDA